MSALLGAGGGFPPLSLTVATIARGKVNYYGYQASYFGSLSPTAFPPNQTETVIQLYYIDITNSYILEVLPTATNSGWTNIIINGLTLPRTSASFSGSTWSWPATDSGYALTSAVGLTVKVSFS